MQSEDFDSSHGLGPDSARPSVGGLRLLTILEPDVPQRRRAPRRRLVAPFLLERRRADRRNAKPGIDGLLRLVLADDWK